MRDTFETCHPRNLISLILLPRRLVGTLKET